MSRVHPTFLKNLDRVKMCLLPVTSDVPIMHNQGHGGKSKHLTGFQQDFLTHLMLAVLGVQKISTTISVHVIQPNFSDANNIQLSQIGSETGKCDILFSILVLQSMLAMDAICRIHRLLLHEMKRSIPVFNEIASYRRFNQDVLKIWSDVGLGGDTGPNCWLLQMGLLHNHAWMKVSISDVIMGRARKIIRARTVWPQSMIGLHQFHGRCCR